ncbi:MAG: glycosyltransferase [Bryobacterales bacterium]|nr:glycosyltransferase [Bryobacterales bacterium]
MTLRLALVSPMPPSRSGIADYSEALAGALRPLAEVTVIASAPPEFDPNIYDAVVYQMGNNPHHCFVYDLALRHPGTVVLHEGNLHHLIADMTVARGDWDSYLREVEHEGGAPALVHARRAKALEVGPDYEGLPMIRRLLERSKAVVVHSRCVEEQVRRAGFQGPVARIPHAAWIPEVDRLAYRSRLGLDESTPLVGIFGFLKPYKRIEESLRAFRRLLKVEPAAKLILAGEPHPSHPLTPLIRTLDLQASVRLLGFVPIEDFTGYMAACDIVLNLRHPTVGESSGSLLRALGLGKAVLVSDVGSFRELPDEVCLKVPVDATEEDVVFEYLNLLVSRPSVAAALGAKARQWVGKELRWEQAAARYADFLRAVANGSAPLCEQSPVAAPAAPAASVEPTPAAVCQPPPPPVEVSEEYILGWAPQGSDARAYAETHLTRLEKTLSITPRGGPQDRVLEMGAYLQLTPALRSRLGYGTVRGCYYGRLGEVEHKSAASESGEVFECDIDLFDAERDPFPYPDGHFATVLCCELIEHLAADPMHMMSEINRILRDGGHLVLTTPNLASTRSISALLLGYHPGLFSVYLRPAAEGGPHDARHHREYTPIEIHLLMEDAGFDVTLLDTGPFRETPRPDLGWVVHLLRRYRLATDLRGDGIYAVGRKSRAVKNRYPAWLYTQPPS